MKQINDLETAKQLRDSNDYTLAVVKHGESIYTSKSKGVLPLYKIHEEKLNFNGASAADRVVGKGAAMFMVQFGLSSVDTYVISKPALEYLQAHNVMVSYNSLVDFIVNRNKDGKCPVETVAETVDDFDALLIEVKKLLRKWGLI